MLISTIAIARTGARLDSDALGMVQIRAWQDITGLHDDRIGEELLLLSSANNEGFKTGCRNARTFLASLTGLDTSDDEGMDISPMRFEPWPKLFPDEIAVFGHNAPSAHYLWITFFDEYVWA